MSRKPFKPHRFPLLDGLTMPVTHRKQKTAYFGSRFGQDVEPSGMYVTAGHNGVPGLTIEPGNHRVVTSHRKVKFKRPLVVKEAGWKPKLSKRFGGRTGRRLSQALRKAGYDGVVTLNPYGFGEIVDLTTRKKR